LGSQRPYKLLLVAGKVIDELIGVGGGQPLHLVVKRQKFASLRFVERNGFAFALELSFVDLALAFRGQIGPRAHRESAGDHSGEAGDQDEFAVTERCSRYTGNDAEDSSQPIVDSVDGIADPACSVGLPLIALGDHFIEELSRLTGLELTDAL